MARTPFVHSVAFPGESTCTMWWHLSDPADVSATYFKAPTALHSFSIDCPPFASIAFDRLPVNSIFSSVGLTIASVASSVTSP